MLNVKLLFLSTCIWASAAFVIPSTSFPRHLLNAATLDEQDVKAAPEMTSSSQIDIEDDDFSSPAEYENSKFNCDPSVLFWQNLQRSGLNDASENIREIINVSNRFASKGGDALNYWLRHNVRSGYFLSNAILGASASYIHERIRSNDVPENGFLNNFVQSSAISRLILETALVYEQDYDNISDQKYKLPYDMYQRSKQSSPLFALQQTGLFVREAVGTLTRSNRGSEDDKKVWISNDSTPDLYPDYYRTAFHYQTDGWMSADSANVYDTSTETLFFGRQDAMQRTALAPLVQYSKEIGRPLKVLEVACGTGRFLTFARDNLPLESEYTALDLSPFYLDKARENDKEWRSLRKRAEEENGNDVKDIQPVSIVQAQAENLPFQDEEFDAVVCIYLFHELPREVRAKAASEMSRVTKNSGRVILCDSTQLGDRPVFDKIIGNFGNMNEPYFRDYIQDYLPRLFEKVGMECLTKSVCASSKALEFKKGQ